MAKDFEPRNAYHHGDLRRTLVRHATDLLDEEGIAGFRLREVARRADVAPAAPSHHFGNVAGLLAAVAAEGFERLVQQFEKIRARKLAPEAHVVAICAVYVSQYQKSPGVFSIMFRDDVLDDQDPRLNEFRPKSLALLIDGVHQAIPESSQEHATSVAKILWATMHGLVTLPLGKERVSLTKRAEFAVRMILAGAVDRDS